MEPHERLNQAMNSRRLELRLQWKQVAAGANISPESLGAIRRGAYRPSELTARGLDETLQWRAGSVYVILDEDGEPENLTGALATGRAGTTDATPRATSLEVGEDPRPKEEIIAESEEILEEIMEIVRRRGLDKDSRQLRVWRRFARTMAESLAELEPKNNAS